MKRWVTIAVVAATALASGLLGTSGAQAEEKPAKEKPAIAGGEINTDKLPWMASIWGQGERGPTQLCGAALIAPRWVVTAAHCIDLAGGTVSMRIGGSRRDEGTVAKSVRAVKHPQYDAQSMSNNVGLLELEDTLPNASPLPLRNFPLWEGAPVRALGWGVTGPQAPSGSNELRHVDTALIGPAGCTWAAPMFHADQMYCYSASEMKLPCLMDSGGPVVHRDTTTGRWSLVGLIGGGDSYCPYGTDYPWFGMSVEHYRNWITSVTGRLHAPGPF